MLRNRMMRGAGYSRAQSPLLLDIYSGAAAAYSLRKLRTAYAGACIRVRRSSDSAEQDIGFVSGVLDTATLLSFVGAGNGFVTTWYDQSGNANNQNQATANQQPVIVSSGVVVATSGKPGLSFNLHRMAGSAGIVASSGFTAIAVATLTASVGSYRRLLSIASDTRFFLGVDSSGNVASLYGNGSGWTAVTANSATAWSGNKLVITCNNGTTDSQFVNGSAITPRAATFTPYSTALEIGERSLTGSQEWIGVVQEVIVYGSNQSASRAAIESNINSHYSIY